MSSGPPNKRPRAKPTPMRQTTLIFERRTETDSSSRSFSNNGEKKSAATVQPVLFGAEHLHVESTPPDGNCLFTALALQLEYYGVTKSASAVRNELVSYMSDNTAKLELLACGSLNDIFGASHGSVRKYTSNMALDREWGDGTMLSIASVAYRRQIEVYLEASPVVKLCDDNDFNSAEPLRIGFLAASKHYVSLVPKVTFKTRPDVTSSYSSTASKTGPDPPSSTTSKTRSDPPSPTASKTGPDTPSSTTSKTRSDPPSSTASKTGPDPPSSTACKTWPDPPSSSDAELPNEIIFVNGPSQPDVACIPSQEICPSASGRSSRLLKFQASWYSTFHWLHYIPDLGGVVCFVCAQADHLKLLYFCKRREDTFISKGFHNWKKGPEKFRDHERSECHTLAVSQIAQHQQSNPVSAQLSDHHMSAQKKAQKGLEMIFTTIKYLARQGLALRGHLEDDGNFTQLLRLRQSDLEVPNLFLEKDTVLKYTSHDIQNEILSLFGQQIVRNITNNVRIASQFAVIVDGTTDIAGCHQESICIRFVDQNLQPHEEFIGFYEAPNSTGSTISNCVFDVLTRLQLPVEQLRGQTYDGASNMAGAYRGCQALVKLRQPLALYVHCGAHCINLVSQTACESVPLIRDCLAVVQELGSLFSASSNLRTSFTLISQDAGLPTKKIKPLCPTRWLVRVNAIKSLLSQYSQVMESLVDIGKSTSNAATRCSGLLKQLMCGCNLLGFMIALDILTPLEQLNRSLQSSSATVGGMLQTIEQTLSDLQDIRSESAFTSLLNKATQRIDELQLDVIEMPRVRRPPSRLTGQSDAYIAKTITDHFRPIYFNVLDVAIKELEERFRDNGDLKIYRSMEDLLLLSVIDEDARKLMCPYKEIVWADLKVQLPLFLKQKYSTLKEATELLRSMSVETRSYFSEVTKLVRLLLVCPAASVEAERSFSALRRMKTWLRSTMLQERLNDIALCNIHQEVLDEVDMKPLLIEFATRNSVRANIFGHFD